jgi:hypothetical protein
MLVPRYGAPPALLRERREIDSSGKETEAFCRLFLFPGLIAAEESCGLQTSIPLTRHKNRSKKGQPPEQLTARRSGKSVVERQECVPRSISGEGTRDEDTE